MAVQLLSESPIFHGMALDLTDEEIVPKDHLTDQFRTFLNGTMGEMWMGDPHEPKPGREPKALPATGSMPAITAHGEKEFWEIADDNAADVMEIHVDDEVVQTITVHDSVTIEDPDPADIGTAMMEPVDVVSTQVFGVAESDVPTVTIRLEDRKQARGKNTGKRTGNRRFRGAP